MNKLYLIIFVAASVLIAKPRGKDIKTPQQIELEKLKAKLENVRDGLQRDIADRWRKKQKHIHQREIDKEELARLRDVQERTYLDFSRVKEECFARERTIEDEKVSLQQKKEAWTYVAKDMDDVFEKEGKNVLELFPLDREERRLKLETIRQAYSSKRGFLASLEDFINYKQDYIVQGTKTSIVKQNIIPDDGTSAQHLNIARFGHVFGYGQGMENKLYIIRQTGLLGVGRFKTEEITEPDFSQSLFSAFPSWIEKGRPEGTIQVDVMQNAFSGALISGKQTSRFTRIASYLKSGGAVMIPLLILPFWALILIIFKLIQFAIKRRTGSNLSHYVLEKLKNEDVNAARDYVKNKKGVVAKVVATCLDHSEWNREAAETAVKGIIIEEVPQLNKHLNTLAVIAGVAPLLGLLGTVTGMIELFDVITNYGTGDPKIMASGISVALVTTQTGLSIAIPIMLIHNYIRNVRDKIKAEMEKHAIVILNTLWPTGDKSGSKK